MRAREFIVDGVLKSKIIRDNIGGFIKIHPDPDNYHTFTKFSMVYINTQMGNYYGINNRIIGIDTHDHVGYNPHLMQRNNKIGYYRIDIMIDFMLARHLFFGILTAIQKRYLGDINAYL
jgi:hypothetical protein